MSGPVCGDLFLSDTGVHRCVRSPGHEVEQPWHFSGGGHLAGAYWRSSVEGSTERAWPIERGDSDV